MAKVKVEFKFNCWEILALAIAIVLVLWVYVGEKTAALDLIHEAALVIKSVKK